MTAWTPALEVELRYLIQLDYQHQQRAASACQGKPAFSSSQHARDSMPRRTIHGRVTVYRCNICDKWHVGSHLSSKAREKRPMRVIGGDEDAVA